MSKSPVAFMSYVRFDDHYENGRLSEKTSQPMVSPTWRSRRAGMRPCATTVSQEMAPLRFGFTTVVEASLKIMTYWGAWDISSDCQGKVKRARNQE
jgi:hypothetical protein